MSFAAIVLLLASIPTAPVIDVVYPRPAPGDTIPYIERVDSNFVFGSVKPAESRLWIDGVEAELHENGSFLVFQPVDWDSKRYRLRAESGGETTFLDVRFTTKPVASVSSAPALSPSDFPRILELSGQPLRTDPKGTYFIFPTAGTLVMASAISGGYYRIPLATGRSAWVEGRTIKRDAGKGTGPEPVVAWKIEIDTLDGGTSLFIPLDRKILVRLFDEADPGRIVFEMFGAVSHIDRISFPPGTEWIREVTWEQTADATLKVKVSLSSALWGYSARWVEKGFLLTFRPPPRVGRKLDGLRVALDPGHGGSQDGAIGPTRLKEKDVNLRCAEALVNRLEKLGAAVFLTLDRDSTMGLADRTAAAERFGADILISLHHNALPDGVNPFGHYGSGTHYYRPQSRDLALMVQRALVEELSLPDEGIYYDDLALVRPTAQPAILLEAAYMMLPEQEQMVGHEEYPGRLAKAVEKGIVQFLRERLVR